MGVVLLIFLILLAIAFLGLVALSCGSSPLAPAARILLALMCGAMALFCVYGFLASFEPSEQVNWFKAGYATGFLVFLAIGSWAVLTRPPAAHDRSTES